ncbi:nuclease-related domain-containing protein [Halalkalibacillus halophilus]|uniref:nuclease-related domain-containing protein n=1 Tax=Halalkalibacillus halophilus TaxID=392827 RepID=UPI00040AA8E6|nr:nuclease-related domain-containing protein [Halalkalibacillus halophilus]
MNFSPLQKPSKLLALEAITPRLSVGDPLYEKFEIQLKKETTGYYGEKSLDYYFKMVSDQAIRLSDLRLSHSSGYFQIDHLLLFKSFLLIVEVKTFHGNFTYDPQTRKLEKVLEHGGTRRYDCPVTQASIQKKHLQSKLQYWNAPPIPIHTLAVFAEPSATLTLMSPEQDFIYSQQILNRLPELQQFYKQDYYRMQDLKSLAFKLKEHAEKHHVNLVDQFGISRDRIRCGVWCTGCKIDMMNRSKRSWHCPSCGHQDSQAHRKALQEYKHIYGERITNKEAREFLRVESSEVVKRMLINSCKRKEGSYRHTVYYV